MNIVASNYISLYDYPKFPIKNSGKQAKTHKLYKRFIKNWMVNKVVLRIAFFGTLVKYDLIHKQPAVTTGVGVFQRTYCCNTFLRSIQSNWSNPIL